MNIVLRNTKPFRNIFETIKDSYNHLDLRFNHNGLFLQCLDISRVSILEIFLDRSYFSSYTIENEEVVSVFTENFVKCCHCLQPDDTLVITYDEECLYMTIKSDLRTNKLKLNTILTNDELLNCDSSLNHTHVFKMTNKCFSQYYSDIKLFNCDSIHFINNGKKELFNIKGEYDNGEIDIECKCDGETIHIMKSKTTLDVEYPIKQFGLINKLTSIFDRCTLNLGNEIPIRINCILEKDSYFRIIIAPKMND